MLDGSYIITRGPTTAPTETPLKNSHRLLYTYGIPATALHRTVRYKGKPPATRTSTYIGGTKKKKTSKLLYRTIVQVPVRRRQPPPPRVLLPPSAVSRRHTLAPGRRRGHSTTTSRPYRRHRRRRHCRPSIYRPWHRGQGGTRDRAGRRRSARASQKALAHP